MAGKKFPYLTAFVACTGGCGAARNEVGEPLCAFGCLGCGACVSTCKFGAIRLADDTAAVDPEICKACGACIRACPRGLIRLRESGMPIQVRCSNLDTGKTASAACASACIGCGLCAKKCPADAITMTDHLPVIDESRCLSCGMCAVSCPRGAIRDLRGILTER